jgi:aspartyl-tRNA(Asn)/glutamyl-tRNA(Gln) amidotransferase subunit B
VDAGKLLHEIGALALPYSLVDFNRSGVPLCEIVTEPDIANSDEAFAYLTELKAILQYMRVSNCDMEKGEMRCDANVSIRPKGSSAFGVRTEIKNLNSFRNVKDAIEFEIGRQAKVLNEGGKVVQETRLWDAEKGETRPMRSKEQAHDYRYFPEPDLVPLEKDPAFVASLKANLPKLPKEVRAEFVNLGLSEYDAGVLASSRTLAERFKKEVELLKREPAACKAAANFETNQHLAYLNNSGIAIEDSRLKPEYIAAVVELIQSATVSSGMAKELLEESFGTGKDPRDLVKEKGLTQISDDGQLTNWAEEAIRESPKAVADFKSGNERAIGALVGSVMKKSNGKANAGKVNEVLKRLLSQN